MTDKEAESFLNEVRNTTDDNVIDLEDAISIALARVPKIDHERWFGAIGNGVYYGNSYESRWFPDCSVREAAAKLMEEMV